MPITLPDSEKRITILGRTGTGKTVAALWHLSNYPLDDPWVIFNFKNDKNIDSIKKARHVPIGYVPTEKQSGLFVCHPLPHECKGTFKEKSPVEKYLWDLWQRENVGILIDEALIIGENDALNALYSQGRSKNIPIITGSQRPVGITRWAFTEANYIQAFHLNDEADRERVEDFTPLESEDFDRLGKHESYYYDVSENDLARLRPVPSMEKIRAIFDEKLRPQRVMI